MKKQNKNAKRIQRHHKVRMKVAGTNDRPRLTVFRSNGHIYAQLIDDTTNRTLLAVNDMTIKMVKGDFAKVAKAKQAGVELAKLAQAKKIKQVVFDRGGYIYTGRIKALAEGAREGGLEF